MPVGGPADPLRRRRVRDLLAYLALADRLEAFTVSKLGPIIALALWLSPCGAEVRPRRVVEARPAPGGARPTHVAGGVIRYFQIFLAAMYSGAGIAKLRGDWLSGDVLWSHLHDNYQTAISWFLVRSVPGWGWQALQYLSLTFEVAAPLWFLLPWTRKPAVVVALSMHAMIGLMFGPVIWFALLMSTLLVGCYAPSAGCGAPSAPTRRPERRSDGRRPARVTRRWRRRGPARPPTAASSGARPRGP